MIEISPSGIVRGRIFSALLLSPCSPSHTCCSPVCHLGVTAPRSSLSTCWEQFISFFRVKAVSTGDGRNRQMQASDALDAYLEARWLISAAAASIVRLSVTPTVLQPLILTACNALVTFLYLTMYNDHDLLQGCLQKPPPSGWSGFLSHQPCTPSYTFIHPCLRFLFSTPLTSQPSLFFSPRPPQVHLRAWQKRNTSSPP